LGAFFFLYIILIIYALLIRFASRHEIRAQCVGKIYKFQAVSVVLITSLASASISFLFAQHFADWLYQFIPAFIVAAIVAVDKPIKLQ
jgi:hypothetical protein